MREWKCCTLQGDSFNLLWTNIQILCIWFIFNPLVIYFCFFFDREEGVEASVSGCSLIAKCWVKHVNAIIYLQTSWRKFFSYHSSTLKLNLTWTVYSASGLAFLDFSVGECFHLTIYKNMHKYVSYLNWSLKTSGKNCKRWVTTEESD